MRRKKTWTISLVCRPTPSYERTPLLTVPEMPVRFAEPKSSSSPVIFSHIVVFIDFIVLLKYSFSQGFRVFGAKSLRFREAVQLGDSCLRGAVLL